MADESKDYISYLLRLWKTQEDGNPVWRASLQSVQTGERKMFADLSALFEFLARHFDAIPSQSDRGNITK